MLNFANATKKATNLSLNAKVLQAARDLGMNVSQTVNTMLADEVKKRYWAKWNEDNKEAIDAYNERVKTHGIWGAKYRTFGKSSGDGRGES